MTEPNIRYSSVEVFAKPDCAYCERAKALLDRRGLSYREIDVSIAANRDEMHRRLPSARSTPQIFIAGRYIGGFDDLAILAQDGDLDAMAQGEVH